MINTKSIRTSVSPFLFYVLWALSYLRSTSKPNATSDTVSALKLAGKLSSAVLPRPSELPTMKISAYHAAMLRLGQNIDQFELVHSGQEIQDGEHFFRNVVFRNFIGDTFVLEVITDDNGKLIRPWELENDCYEVRLVQTDDGLEYREIGEEN